MRDFSGSTEVEVGEGPEDVLVDASGRVCTGLADGRIVRLAGPGQAPETVARVPGRPAAGGGGRGERTRAGIDASSAPDAPETVRRSRVPASDVC